MQVLGAIATLVLLGLPWIFSLAGALDTEKDEVLDTVKLVLKVFLLIVNNICTEKWSKKVKQQNFAQKHINV